MTCLELYSALGYTDSIEPYRDRFNHIIGTPDDHPARQTRRLMTVPRRPRWPGGSPRTTRNKH